MSNARELAELSGSYGTGGFVGMKNRIINGAMVIDQRNAGASQTVTTSGAFTVDRFFVQPTGASVTTQQVTGSGQYKNALRITGAASVTQCFIQQKIEASNSYDLAGQTVTVTIRASSSTLTSLTCYVERATAGVDNWSTFATDKTQAITITSAPTDYTFQATLSGSATNGIRFIFSTGAFTSGTLDITGIQLEKGNTATSFDHRQYGTELQLCQRYYQQSSSGPLTNGANASSFGNGAKELCAVCIWGGASIAVGVQLFPTPMRTTPSMSKFGNSNGDYGYLSAGASGPAAVASFTFSPNSNPGAVDAVSYRINNQVSGSPLWGISGSWNASAEL
jgi:hypothetical protein